MGPTDGLSMRKTYIFMILVLSGLFCFSCSSVKEQKKERVFLLHGMGRSTMSLLLLKSHLKHAGYLADSYPYNAAKKDLDQITKEFLEHVMENTGGEIYHLIGHSLGNIIIRNGFKKGYPPGLGRIVMLAPPNQPQDAAQAVSDNPIFKKITGDCGEKLGDVSFYCELPVPGVEFVVIAGDAGPEFLFGEPNDCVVTVESTRLEGMKEHLVLHRTHTFIMNSSDAKNCCVNFLKHGAFRE